MVVVGSGGDCGGIGCRGLMVVEMRTRVVVVMRIIVAVMMVVM